MESFSNDQNQFSLIDPVYLPESPSLIPLNIERNPEEISNELYFPSHYYRQESKPVSFASSFTETLSSSKMKSEDSQWKKRKQRNVNCQTTPLPKSKCKRTKKSCSEKNVLEEKKPPTDYIHVRARSGQATDSHSLAERVRREKISERMKILQDLVPGCEKVTGKALILDAIINYVESLKNQVEFLSMELASVNPNLLEFGLNFDDLTSRTENLVCNPQVQSSMVQSSHIQSPGDNIAVMASSSTTLFYGGGPTEFPQDAESYFSQIGDQTEALEHQFDLFSMCSFQ